MPEDTDVLKQVDELVDDGCEEHRRQGVTLPQASGMVNRRALVAV